MGAIKRFGENILKKWHLNHEYITKHVNHATIKISLLQPHLHAIVSFSSLHIFYVLIIELTFIDCKESACFFFFIMISFDMKLVYRLARRKWWKGSNMQNNRNSLITTLIRICERSMSSRVVFSLFFIFLFSLMTMTTTKDDYDVAIKWFSIVSIGLWKLFSRK